MSSVPRRTTRSFRSPGAENHSTGSAFSTKELTVRLSCLRASSSSSQAKVKIDKETRFRLCQRSAQTCGNKEFTTCEVPPADLHTRLVPLHTQSRTQCRRVAVPSVRNVCSVCISSGLRRIVLRNHDVYLQKNETKSEARLLRGSGWKSPRLSSGATICCSRKSLVRLRRAPGMRTTNRPDFVFISSILPHRNTTPLQLKRNQRPFCGAGDSPNHTEKSRETVF